MSSQSEYGLETNQICPFDPVVVVVVVVVVCCRCPAHGRRARGVGAGGRGAERRQGDPG